jgi:hypothetical protein
MDPIYVLLVKTFFCIGKKYIKTSYLRIHLYNLKKLVTQKLAALLKKEKEKKKIYFLK